MSKRLAATYKRDSATRGESIPYERKFGRLIDLCEDARSKQFENLIVAWPWVLGDTYDELLESLSCIADAGLARHIVKDTPTPESLDVSKFRH